MQRADRCKPTIRADQRRDTYLLARQVGAIQSVQVDIENEVKDQRETRKNEERKLRHWHKETAKKREQIAAAFAEGARQTRSKEVHCSPTEERLVTGRVH